MDAPKKKRKSYYNERSNKYAQQYERDNYDRIAIRFLKTGDLTKETVESAAAAVGESVNAYVTEAVRRRIASEK